MKKFKWQPNRITKVNINDLKKRFLVPGRFKRYSSDEIPDQYSRGWVNSNLHFRISERVSKVKLVITPEMTRVYKRHGILELSKILDYPPWNLFVRLNKSNGTKSDYYHEQMKIALLNDIQSPLMQKIGKKKADKFEAKMIKFFKKQGVKIKDEKDLVQEQIDMYGKPMWTVDLWFADNPIMINGHKVHWIECKNYMLTESINKLFLPSVRKQLRKYRAQWGPGAVAFSKGFTCNLNEKGILVLDAHEFKKKIKIEKKNS
jgi:hypothetical protein